MQKLTYLITPTLIYFSIQGSDGAKNLLLAYQIVGLLVALLVLVGGLICLACNLGLSKSELSKFSKEIEDFYDGLRKLKKKMRWIDYLCLIYLAIFAFFGWWMIFTLEIIQMIIIKGVANFVPEKE